MSTNKIPKVIFVDDELHLHEIVKLALEGDKDFSKYEMLHFYDGEECWEYLKEVELGREILIFSDIIMPKMDGLRFHKKIKTFKPHIVFHFISATKGSIGIDDNFSWSDTRFFQKPISFSAIKSEIRNFISKNSSIGVS